MAEGEPSGDANDPKLANNPYAWLTPEKYLKFLDGRGISRHCELCRIGNEWWVDTGSHDGYIPRFPSMPQTADGKAAIFDTYQMAVARAVCVNCGNVRIHAIWVLELWRANYETLGLEWGASNAFDAPKAIPDE